MNGKSWIVPAVRTGIGLYSAYSQTRTNTTRKRKFESTGMQGSTTLRRTKRRIGRKKYRSSNRVYRELLSRQNRCVFRWQQVSPSLLGPGRVAIQWCDQGANTEFDKMPMHFMSISQYPFGTRQYEEQYGGLSGGLRVLQYANGSPGNGDWVYSLLPSQDAVGGPDESSGAWYLESQNGRPDPSNEYVFRHHAWTQVKLNLYGTFAVPITYTVMFYQCPQNLDPQRVAPGLPGHQGGSESANMFKDIARSLTGNNLLLAPRVEWPRDCRILKMYKKTIQPIPFSDQIDVATSSSKTAHVETMNIFFQHDRLRDYRWCEQEGDQITNHDLTAPTWDTYRESSLQNDVEWGKKVYMMITATCPERLTPEYASALLVTDTPSVELTKTAGSYDIIVRQCFYLSGGG